MSGEGNGSEVATGFLSHPFVFTARTLMYAVTPNETSFPTVEKVPKFVDKAVPVFLCAVAVEMIILILQGRKDRLPRANDAMSSLLAGQASLLPVLLFRNIELTAYIWLHKNYCIVELPWDSPVTWWLCMLGVDLAYYWVHRCAHEVNFMWAAHQVHHSSEDYNLSTALRQSALQRYSSWIFYLPMAFFIPPSIFYAHIQFNLLYQFWIHTEVVGKLGPLEYILNTPSHHRVHHGRNRYCIDRNYAGTLIIWDRMFNTFVSEDEEVVYGLVHPLKSWDVLYTQFCHWSYILRKSFQREEIWNKIWSFIKGPGWEPGKPRLGHITDIPNIHAPQKRYDKTIHPLLSLYAYTHFFLSLTGYFFTGTFRQQMSFIAALLAVLYLLWTLTDIGYIYEKKWYVPYLEVLRCLVFFIVEANLCSALSCPTWLFYIRTIFMASMVFWALRSIKTSISPPAKKDN